MKINRLVLSQFRNYGQKEFEFGDGVTVVAGANTAGKTNLLEAIYLLARGESFREGKVEEMVNWGSEVGHVVASVSQQQIPNSKLQMSNKAQMSDVKIGEVELQVTVTRGVVQGKRVSKRRFLVNGVGRSRQKLVGNLVVVCFRPEDMRVVEGSPGRRRNFLDEMLEQVDADYVRARASYDRGLRRRNRTLQMIREGRMGRTALEFWDRLVVKNGVLVQEKRGELVEAFNKIKNQESKPITTGENSNFFGNLEIEYRPSVMSEKRLLQYKEREVAVGYTLVGPHRDDFKIIAKSKIKNQKSKLMSLRRIYDEESNGRDLAVYESRGELRKSRDLAVYGSRGEQRLGVLWLKIRALEFVEDKIGVRPVLLLDDIFSELDRENRKLIVDLARQQQTVITTAEEGFVKGLEKRLGNVQVVRL